MSVHLLSVVSTKLSLLLGSATIFGIIRQVKDDAMILIVIFDKLRVSLTLFWSTLFYSDSV